MLPLTSGIKRPSSVTLHTQPPVACCINPTLPVRSTPPPHCDSHLNTLCYLCTPSSLFLQTPSSSNYDETAKQPDNVNRWSIQNWKETVFKVTNIASILCAIDCTILPLVTLLFPLLGLASSAATSEFLHQLGHAVARYFVLPLGALNTALNYFVAKGNKEELNQGKKRLAKFGLFILGIAGCVLIALANSGGLHHHHIHRHHDNLQSHVYTRIISSLQHGLGHRVTNLIGCACLLTSNYLSRHSHSQHDGCCNHDH